MIKQSKIKENDVMSNQENENENIMSNQEQENENIIPKAFVFKTKCGKNDIISFWKPATEEYCNYYNKLSQWICDNLTTIKVKDLLVYVDEEKKTKPHKDKKTGEIIIGDDFYTYFLDKQDAQLYWLFTKKCPSRHTNNLLYDAIVKLNVEGYNGNMFDLAETYYRREGYFKNVVSNYRTKMNAGVKLGKIKRVKLNIADATDEILTEQCILDIDKYKIESKKDFKELITYLKNREEKKSLEEEIERLKALYAYYTEHEDEIKNKISNLIVDNLKEFGGCIRKNMDSCSVYYPNFPMRCVNNTDYEIELISGKKSRVIGLLGNRQVVRYDNGQRKELTDIVNNHGNQTTFKIKNGVLFTCLTNKVEFNKQQADIKNVVGVDINIKHNMLATSILDDGNVKGYVNLYRELVNDDDFVASFGDSESGSKKLELYRQMSKTVNFGILETDSLFERFVYQKNNRTSENELIRREQAMLKVFDNIINTTSDIHIKDYVHYVKMMRAKCKAYFTLKEKYYEKQHEYDHDMGFTDESTESKETMDPRRSEFPFINTEIAQGLLSKLNIVEQDVIGCRDNIVTYAYNVFKKNDYDTISLEYLDSSQFKKLKMPMPKSLLKYHHFEGHTKNEVNKLIAEKKFNEELYKFKYENEKLTGIKLSNQGIIYQQKLNFRNEIIKSIHFADIKDKFVQLSNKDDSMNVVFCPAAFTSQMDSNTHSLYFIKGKKGKWVLADKKQVRTIQETHINGLNADYNSARNLEYIPQNKVLRDIMMVQTKSGKDMYNNPSWNIQKRFKKNVGMNVLKTLMELGNIKYGMIDENGMFVETGK